ncbi:MAG: hypothetical protein Faunusvirus1_32 [Faunusvirus sp.]|jgi:hypothetical protein|uniref:Uncharacterized protein n=1 Tax=Faunusvirus sp. TaxID=2487766 RepID=A0A3G4ZVT5_9VIRU|nr:MAG: hypothetical protein Faunusvirus1_32 [Faunusvirus sp.]
MDCVTTATQTKQPSIKPNTVDPITGNIVKRIDLNWTSHKTGKPMSRMVWQYYRDRSRAGYSVDDIFKKYKGYTVEIIYSGDPVKYKFDLA